MFYQFLMTEAGYSLPLTRCVALADFLARNIAHYIGHLKLDAKMTGSFAALKGGNLEIAVPSQKILERTSVIVCTGYVEVRLLYGLTAHGKYHSNIYQVSLKDRFLLGRTITSEPVITMFSEMVPRLIHRAIEYSSQSPRLIQSHLECYEDQQWLRKQLSSHGKLMSDLIETSQLIFWYIRPHCLCA